MRIFVCVNPGGNAKVISTPKVLAIIFAKMLININNKQVIKMISASKEINRSGFLVNDNIPSKARLNAFPKLNFVLPGSIFSFIWKWCLLKSYPSS